MATAAKDQQVESRSTQVPWYTADLETISEPARQLLETYSKIPPDQVIPHIIRIREAAWKVHPYPCIGRFRFLDLSITLSPLYPTILTRIRSGAKLLDLGCCFGQDIRTLVAAGGPPQNIYGTDLRAEFWELGYELFRDRETLGVKFVTGDIFDEGPTSGLRQLDGRVDIVHMASFLHLFNWEGQVRACKRLVRLLSPAPGSVVFGRQRGNVKPGEYDHRTNAGGTMYRHDVESWKKLCEQVGNETGTNWDVKGDLLDTEEEVGEGNGTLSLEEGWRDANDRQFRFEVQHL